MTYISAELTENRKNVIVWERLDNGDRDYRIYTAPYYFYIEDEDGKHRDIYGKKLLRLDFNYSKEMYDAREECKSKGIKMYESDIAPEYKILSEHYYGKPVGKLNITFLDIEVDKDSDKGYATINDPYAPIISVALYHQYSNRSVVYAVPPDNTWSMEKIPQEIQDLSDVVLCKNEQQLLKCLLAEIDNSDVLSHWNGAFFDIPYIYARLDKVLGPEYSRKLSFPNSKPPKFREVEKFKVLQKTLDIFGRISLDYLEVFRKLEQEGRPSYALEAIADELLPELPKLEYEGSLSDLYRNDFLFFIRYNIRDTEILKGFEEKLGYIEFAVNFTHLATGLMNDILGTIKLTDMTLLNKCHYEMNTIVPDINQNVISEGKYAGALVLDPVMGMHEGVSAVDVVSLYPSAMRSLNISPETIIGQFVEKYKAYDSMSSDSNESLTIMYENGISESNTVMEWKQILKDKKWNISGYGTVYTQEFQGFIPATLTEWFDKRKEYKKEMKTIDSKIQAILGKYK